MLVVGASDEYFEQQPRPCTMDDLTSASQVSVKDTFSLRNYPVLALSRFFLVRTPFDGLGTQKMGIDVAAVHVQVGFFTVRRDVRPPACPPRRPSFTCFGESMCVCMCVFVCLSLDPSIRIRAPVRSPRRSLSARGGAFH